MNRRIRLISFALCVSVPSFAAEHVVSHSAKGCRQGNLQSYKNLDRGSRKNAGSDPEIRFLT